MNWAQSRYPVEEPKLETFEFDYEPLRHSDEMESRAGIGSDWRRHSHWPQEMIEIEEMESPDIEIYMCLESPVWCLVELDSKKRTVRMMIGGHFWSLWNRKKRPSQAMRKWEVRWNRIWLKHSRITWILKPCGRAWLIKHCGLRGIWPRQFQS